MQLSQFWDDFPLKAFSSERLHLGQADQLQEHQNSQGTAVRGKNSDMQSLCMPRTFWTVPD